MRVHFFQGIASLFLGLVLSHSSPALASSKIPHVAITQIVQHPSLDAIRRGVLDVLAEQGYKEGESLRVTYDNAQASPVLATQIAQKFSALSPDVIVAIATPSAQSVLGATREQGIPIVFGAVTDPLSAKLVVSLDKTGGPITGTTDLPPCEAQVALIQKVIPDLKVLGTVYNPGESNNVFQVGLLREVAKKAGIRLVEKTVARATDVPSSARALVGQVQAILLLNDNTVISALEALLRVTQTQNHKIPVFTSDPDSVKRGAVAALANDQYDVGRATGALVVRVLKGEAPDQIPVAPVTMAKLTVNGQVAQDLGLVFEGEADVIAPSSQAPTP